MTTIQLTSEIKATRDVCFDLSRSIDIHQLSMRKAGEEAIGGVTKGLIEEGEWVKWRAKHFLVAQTMTVQIQEMKPFRYFSDEMIQGPFKWMKHYHYYEANYGKTIMTDRFEYDVPYGVLGKIFDKLILKKYMTRLLAHRNEFIKKIAESGEWKKYLDN